MKTLGGGGIHVHWGIGGGIFQKTEKGTNSLMFIDSGAANNIPDVDILCQEMISVNRSHQKVLSILY